jgi:hypothetical protein
MKELPDGEWKDVEHSLAVELKGDKLETVFRAMNLAGVSGPEHKIAISR